MRKFFLILLLSTFSFWAKADHITGGEMYYSYNGLSNGENSYTVTLKLFMRCNSGRQFPNPAIISVFDKLSFERIRDVSIALSTRNTISITDSDPCISNPPTVCYEVAYYTFSISLPLNQNGYILASEVNYRIRGITNINSTQVGATYNCEIPGTVPISNGYANVSAAFTGSDLVIVCANNYFSYSFAAKDDDGDQLRYSFCSAYASTNAGVNGVPAGNPPYKSVPYISPAFSGSFPLGDKVQIDAKTGLITGIAPAAGVYVVTVCVEEVRNTVLIATQRKDLQINIADCSIAAALLNEEYMLCGDTRSIGITNQSNSPLIKTYDWEVLNPAGASIYTTQNPVLNYTFPVNGVYTTRLTVNKGQACSDTTSAKVFVYPGLVPDFSFAGICINRPTFFTDKTTTLSGTVNSWKWDFGVPGNITDVSLLQNDFYSYTVEGLKTASLIVTTTDGCRDTVSKTISMIDKPPIALGFYDTLICVNDRVKLQAAGTGNFSWSPAINMLNANTTGPTVFPVTTTTYYVNLEREGCNNSDSVYVRVVDHVNLQVMNDTIICSRDTIPLRIISDGFQYAWSPAAQLINATVKNPLAITPVTTPYQVIATIGGCSATKNITVTAIPYPFVNAGMDTIICYNTAARLQAFTNGSSWSWASASSLSDVSLLNPIAYPVRTSDYIFNAYDTRGCPKPGIDTIRVTVLPKIVATAGRDTAVVIGQALQLNASGGDTYIWSPALSLSAANIANPIAVFTEPYNGMQYKVQAYNIAGCYDSAFINIKVYATLPTVFIPTAFTPNDDGKNDILRPIAAGMKSIQYFQVYNRWGQLLFSTQTNGQGWNGRINGQLQSNNTYVWVVKAIDFSGAVYFKKGTVTLIR
jgi:gliding motility-associated-like protein